MQYFRFLPCEGRELFIIKKMKRSDVYKILRDRLLSEIPDLTTDVNRGQMDHPKPDYPLPLPLALITFSRIRWDVYAKGVERGELTVSVDYYKVICSNMFSGSESENETLKLLDSPDEIYRALAYFSVNGLFDELYREEESEIKSGGRLIGYRVTFKANVYEEF